jgi:PAT family beta-lactamase induction signal transducer AmpG
VQTEQDSWDATLKLFLHRRVITMLFLGFSAGIPLLLIFSSLSLWLREAGVDRAVVTYFSWAALGYSFKFVWAPLVDQLPLPWLSAVLGRRRAWMLVAQCAIVAAILLMASIDPGQGDSSLTLMAVAAVMLGFSSATQDIVIDAFRIESADVKLQALLSSTYIIGYRLAMLLTGAGSLYLAEGFGSTSEIYNYQAWQYTYMLMAAAMIVGVVTTLVIDEPERSKSKSYLETTQEYGRFLLLFALAVTGFIGVYVFSSEVVTQLKVSLATLMHNEILAALLVEALRLATAVLSAWAVAIILVKMNIVRYAMLERTYLMPIRDFFERYGWSFAWILLALIGLYRISDIV